MAYRYSPHTKFEAKADPARCPASVPGGGRMPSFHQCLKKRGQHPDGWCRVHDPAAEAKRREATEGRYKDKLARDREHRVAYALSEATTEQLETELKRRRALAVACPQCGSKPGEPCRWPVGGKTCEPHLPRRKAARA